MFNDNYSAPYTDYIHDFQGNGVYNTDCFLTYDSELDDGNRDMIENNENVDLYIAPLNDKSAFIEYLNNDLPKNQKLNIKSSLKDIAKAMFSISDEWYIVRPDDDYILSYEDSVGTYGKTTVSTILDFLSDNVEF